MRAALVLVAVLLVAGSFAACGDDKLHALSQKPDAGTTSASPDAGTQETPDAGPAEETPDAGAVDETPDAGPVEEPPDAGPIDPDSPCAQVADALDPSASAATATIRPNESGGPFGGFQSTAGTGQQSTIVVTFSRPVRQVSVTILDPDFSGNRIVACAGPRQVDERPFVGDGQPGTYTEDTQTVSGLGLTKVLLVPDPQDYVAYKDLQFIE